MIKNYLKKTNNRTEAKEIDFETGIVKLYQINNGSENCGIDFPFSEYMTTYKEMGYESVNHMIKELKKRGQLGEEVPHEEQKHKEIEELLKLAKFRKGNGWNLADIPVKLEKYYNMTLSI